MVLDLNLIENFQDAVIKEKYKIVKDLSKSYKSLCIEEMVYLVRNFHFLSFNSMRIFKSFKMVPILYSIRWHIEI